MNAFKTGLSGRTVGSALPILVVVLVLATAARVEAKDLSGSVTIEAGKHYGWRMDIAIPSEIEYEIRCSNGSRVDVLVMDENNYTKYAGSLDCSYLSEFSVLGASNSSVNFTVLSGSVFIVIDNTAFPATPGAASPAGSVTVLYWIGNAFDLHAVGGNGTPVLSYIVLAGAAVMFVSVVVLTRTALRGRKKPKGQYKD